MKTTDATKVKAQDRPPEADGFERRKEARQAERAAKDAPKAAAFKEVPADEVPSGKTVQVFIRGLDADIHHRFKVACAQRGKSQTQVLKELILKYTREKEGAAK